MSKDSTVSGASPVPADALAEKIDDLLPQTQCGKCGYPGCMPYAEAIAAGKAKINLCPPGGDEGIRDLAELLGVPFQPFEAGVAPKPPSVAFIDENLCIGCTLCIQACPVDAIAGASKVMHTVIAALCTGCELCVAPCPVDCISMLPLPAQAWTREQKRAARERHQFRNERLERDKREKAERLAQKEKAATKAAAAQQPNAQTLIQAALERAKAQAATVKPKNLDRLTPAQQAQIDEAEARRAKAREQAKTGNKAEKE